MTIEGPELVVFDFDESIVDCDSDQLVCKLSPEGKVPKDIVEKYYNGHDTTEYMSQVFKYLHKTGVTEQDIRNCLKRMPLITGLKHLIINMKNSGPKRFELIIISNANTVFIGQSLEFHRIDKAFRYFIFQTLFSDTIPLIVLFLLHSNHNLS